MKRHKVNKPHKLITVKAKRKKDRKKAKVLEMLLNYEHERYIRRILERGLVVGRWC